MNSSEQQTSQDSENHSTGTKSHYNAQFLFDSPAKLTESKPSFFEGAKRSLTKSTATIAIVAGLVGGVVVALASFGVTALSGGGGVVLINDSSSVNWVTAAAAKASPSVVTIEVSGSNTGGSGSGVVLTASGYILTNNHVITLEGATATPKIEVKTSDGLVFSASVIGTDPTNDLAVIKITPMNKLVPINFADSSKVNVGQNVIAIGAPLGLDATVTSGIVSALDRTIQVANSAAPENSNGGGLQFYNGSGAAPININVIQTDAAINPGNSGGALINENGNLLGINVAIASASDSASGSIGVGFAIPANNALRVANEIMATGKASHAMLGAYVVDAQSSTNSANFSVGAKIEKVMPNSPALKFGLKVGDVITKVNDKKIESSSDLTATIRLMAAGAKVTLEVQRGGKVLNIDVTLGDAVNLK